MVLVIGAILGPLAVVVFSTLRTLTRLALQLVLAVSHAAEPELATAYGANNRARLQSLFVHALRAGLWLALAAAAGLALFGSFILDVWTHGKVAMEPALFAWLLGSAVASVLWYGALIVLKAANRHLRAATVFVFASAGAVGVAALLFAWTGSVASAGPALLLMDAVMALYTFCAAAQLLGVKPAASLVQAVDPRPLAGLAVARVHIH
jgi:O-antigen/teichoic acid export membrane protein